MSKPFIHIQNLRVQYGVKTVLQDLVWTIPAGTHWVIGGKSGTGKTTLAKAIAGEIPYQGVIEWGHAEEDVPPISTENGHAENTRSVLYVPNWYQFSNQDGDRNFYYQQRYQAQQSKDTRTVRQELQHTGEQEALLWEQVLPLVDALGLQRQLDSQLIELSSGEHKKMQLVKALWRKPQLLILDEPYTGLDKASRKALNDRLDALAGAGTQIILLSNDPDLPSCIGAYAGIENGKILLATGPQDFTQNTIREPRELPDFLKKDPAQSGVEMVSLHHVQVRYGDKTVLEDISWQVKRGERWLVQGANGSGKSTMLSLINGDHPQAYGHDIRLFGNPRGSGESIWDIKQKIGLISPELHWYFDPEATVWQAVASGLHDSMGLFKDLSYSEGQQVEQLLQFFDLATVKSDKLQALPLGKQRLALLARTIIKNPPLLVLDEPCQGLDQAQTRYFNDVLDELAAYGKTLIYVGHYESQLPKCISHRLELQQGKVIVREQIGQNNIVNKTNHVFAQPAKSLQNTD